MLYAKCPHCNVMLFEDDCIDIEDEGDRIVRRIVGSCAECGKRFQWREYYNYIEASDPDEIV